MKKKNGKGAEIVEECLLWRGICPGREKKKKKFETEREIDGME